ncbi:MAG TPA: DUF5076 domain-containing protein [Gemmataceae bacterium]|nr:DUF5076 domain-containing protein [Gemmataceae bacterium]
MTKHSGELPIPSAAEADAKGLELARIWAAQRRQYVTIRTNVWKDPGAWGIMLVDFAKHVADAYARDKGEDPNTVLSQIKQGFDAEWGHPTDEPRPA